jgi:2,4-dienoyl-CoA reductase-like NADH-dependent reductase (Old Yellow Enzyme family)
MCQYSSEDGFANDWHLVHLGSRAVGGAALVIMEASAVEARGRISPQDHGIWKDEHIPLLARITGFLRQQGAAAGIQIAHAGRKASTYRPWEGSGAVPPEAGGWQPVAPSPLPFQPDYPMPKELTATEIAGIGESFAAAARRALEAGFQVVELHYAHGYLMHEFLSPLSNHRTDEYGGSFENRIRFALETAKAVRAVWPERLPLFVRISARDWVEGGWDIDESVELSGRLCALGVDLIDCSSGGLAPQQKIQLGPGYQAPFAERIKRDAGIRTGAVGLITSAAQADEIVRNGQADLVLLAREFLRDPYFPLHAAKALGETVPAPIQYQRAF